MKLYFHPLSGNSRRALLVATHLDVPLDRILVDLLSLYRDILLMQLGVTQEPVNLAIFGELDVAAKSSTPARTLETLDSIAAARKRIEGNVAPALALEAMLISAIRQS